MKRSLLLSLIMFSIGSFLSASTPAGKVTGLIIDAAHLKLSRSFTPKIYDTDGTEIYGTIKIKDHSGDTGWEADEILSKGVVAYENSVRLAMNGDRAGKNSLVVKAVKTDEFREAVTITKEDAKMILDANKKSGFLNKLSVVFVQ